MRVSTFQYYQSSSNNMSNLQSAVTEQVKYLSSGKQVLTAKDAPVENSTLQGYKNELQLIEQYSTNITQADNKNNRQEVSLSSAQDVLMQAQESLINANNGAYTTEDLEAISQAMKSGLNQLIELANTQSETGDYIFSGYQSSTKPFSIDSNNQVTYSGDSGTQFLKISTLTEVVTARPGDDVFLDVPNITGDFSVSYLSNVAVPPEPYEVDEDDADVYVESAKIVDRQSYNASAMTPDLTFDFTDVNADGITEVTITDGSATIVHGPVDFIEGTPIAFNGMEVDLDGNPLPGDQFTLAESTDKSIFDTMKEAIEWIDTLAEGNLDDSKLHQVEYKHLLSQLNESFNHITSVRADVGVTLKAIDTQKNIHLDVEVMVETAAGAIENLDFAKAISDFEQQQLSLQAAQQTFSQIQGLSLFNYI